MPDAPRRAEVLIRPPHRLTQGPVEHLRTWLREVESTHAAVVSGVIPLGTAIVGALSFGQRPSRGFWLCAAGGCAARRWQTRPSRSPAWATLASVSRMKRSICSLPNGSSGS